MMRAVAARACVSTRKAVIPGVSSPDRSLANERDVRGAAARDEDLVAAIRRYPSPSRTAAVLWSAASEPASGSVSAKQPSFLPCAETASRNSFFCASVAERSIRIAHQRVVDAHDHAGRSRRPARPPRSRSRTSACPSGAAVFLRDADARETEGAGPVELPPSKFARLVDLGGARAHGLGREVCWRPPPPCAALR